MALKPNLDSHTIEGNFTHVGTSGKYFLYDRTKGVS